MIKKGLRIVGIIEKTLTIKINLQFTTMSAYPYFY